MILAARPQLEAMLERLPKLPAGLRCTRLHGDYRLAQVLVAQGDVMLIDFEGESGRSMAERRAKGLPLADVAGMVRSFDLAAWTSVSRFAETDPQAPERLSAPATAWRDLAVGAFLAEYETGISGCPSWPGAAAETLMRWELLARLGRELTSDAAHRPARLAAAVARLTQLLKTMGDPSP